MTAALPDCWLLAEWPPGADEPTDYWLSDLPAGTPVEELVRLAKIRWRIEHDYRELKHGLGLDHFEGRSYTAWHRHVTLAALAQAFCTLLRKALTNVLKHAGAGARASVRIGFAPQAVEIEVTDDGTGPPSDAASDEGNGLRGIAERAGILGGEWSAGARPEGGFALHARLALADESASAPDPAPLPAAPR